MPRSRLAVFLLSTYLITWTSWWILAALAHRGITAFGQAPFMVLYLLGGLGPTIAPYISILLTGDRGSIKEFHARLFKWRVCAAWYLAAFLIPAGVEGVALAIWVLIGGESSSIPGLLPWYMFFPFFFVMILGGGLEELGWRGIALPEFQRRLHPLGASAVIGVIWSLWHLPLFFIKGVHQYGMNFYTFSLGVLGLACVLTWIYNRTGSILLCVVLHAAVNATNSLGLKVPTSRLTDSVIEGIIWICVGSALVSMSRKRAIDTAAARRG